MHNDLDALLAGLREEALPALAGVEQACGGRFIGASAPIPP